MEAGDNVLVAAPDGAGKTVVADFAIYLAQERNVKAFYTTPIKALSNQKYHDLVETYGAGQGRPAYRRHVHQLRSRHRGHDHRVLRNMLYEHSTTLDALRYVILDEVHYLADRFRGPVWEEVIIHLPQRVRIIGLSATVSNVEDFSKWIDSVRGDTTLVVSENGPCRWNSMCLFRRTTTPNRNSSTCIDVTYRRRADRQAQRPAGEQARSAGPQGARRRGESVAASSRAARPCGGEGRGPCPQPERHTPRRWAVVDELNYLGMLPGIYFIFSRNGCDQAVEQCINAGLELTTDDEVHRIRRIVDEMVEGQLSQEDLKALQFLTSSASHWRRVRARIMPAWSPCSGKSSNDCSKRAW